MGVNIQEKQSLKKILADIFWKEVGKCN